jgi:hypothetical protein
LILLNRINLILKPSVVFKFLNLGDVYHRFCIKKDQLKTALFICGSCDRQKAGLRKSNKDSHRRVVLVEVDLCECICLVEIVTNEELC